MSLKEKVEAMRIVTKVRINRHGYNLQDVVRTLYAYINELESAAQPIKVESAAQPIKVKVGMIEATVSPGKDGKLGTKDDTVKLGLAKKRGPYKKKASAKKKKK